MKTNSSSLQSRENTEHLDRNSLQPETFLFPGHHSNHGMGNDKGSFPGYPDIRRKREIFTLIELLVITYIPWVQIMAS